MKFYANQAYRCITKLPQRWKNFFNINNPLSQILYKVPIPITESKWKWFQNLKEVIDKEHHTFYDNNNLRKRKNFFMHQKHNSSNLMF